MLALKVIVVVLVTAMVFSVNAPVSFAGAPQSKASVCAREVPSGSVIDSSVGKITLSNGSAVAITHIPCSMTSVVWDTSGNAAYGSLTVSNPYYYTSYSDQWTSPAAPSSGSFGSNQGVGLWDGIGAGSNVVQPIEVYGCIATGDCSNSWRVTSYAIIGGLTWYVTPLSPSLSDTIKGAVTRQSSLASCSGSGPGYTINAQDITASTSTSLTVCDTDLYSTAITGSIEVNHLTTCTQMPNTGSDGFSSISWTAPGTSTATMGTGSDVSFCSASASWDTSNPNNVILNLSWTHS